MVTLKLINHKLHVLLMKVDDSATTWQLLEAPVLIQQDKSLENTATRLLLDQGGMTSNYLEQVKTVGHAQRDWVVSTVYLALISDDADTIPNTKWFPIDNDKVSVPMISDHDVLLSLGVARLHNKALYTTMPTYLLKKQFTLSELRQAFEVILKRNVERKSFRRRVLNAGILKETGEIRGSGRRPAKVYQATRFASDHVFARCLS